MTFFCTPHQNNCFSYSTPPPPLKKKIHMCNFLIIFFTSFRGTEPLSIGNFLKRSRWTRNRHYYLQALDSQTEDAFWNRWIYWGNLWTFKKFARSRICCKKNEAQYFKYLKNNLNDAEFLVICDFAENYAFVFQQAISGFHLNSNHATIYGQLSRTFRFDVLVIYWCRRIRLGIIT